MASPTSDIDQLEHLFRHSYGKVIAILIKRFGTYHLEDIEDAVQEALFKAMKLWPYHGMPNQALGWLLCVAHNQLIDQFRRNQKIDFHQHKLELYDEFELIDDPSLENKIQDDQLKMIFACCHPALSQESQIILTLKLVAGFGNKEVANALIKNEETIAKAYTRAKKKLQNENIRFDHSLIIGLRSRLHIVLKIIYLIFSEGYKPHRGHLNIKRDLCFEAIRLALLLDNNRYCQSASTKALIALMCFHASRFDARQNNNEEIIDLQHQDRTKWNRALIAIGIKYLNQATDQSDDPLDYILEAFISYYHCIAPDFTQTDWSSILRLYDIHLTKQFSPVVALNRLIPLSIVNKPSDAYQLLVEYEMDSSIPKNTLFYAIKGELLFKMQNYVEAENALRKAIDFAENQMEINHLEKKIRMYQNQ